MLKVNCVDIVFFCGVFYVCDFLFENICWFVNGFLVNNVLLWGVWGMGKFLLVKVV